MYEEQLITYVTAKLAKEKGFDFTNIPYRDINTGLLADNVKARLRYFLTEEEANLSKNPTQSLLQKWLREVHGITLLVGMSQHPDTKDEPFKCLSNETKGEKFETKTLVATYFHKTYEEALEKGLQEALNLLKDAN